MSDRLSCDEVTERLGELLDGELQGSELFDSERAADERALRDAVESHLESCARCSAEYARLTALDESLRGEFSDARERASSIADRVLAETPVNIQPMETVRAHSPTFHRVLVAASLAAVACVVIAVVMARPDKQSDSEIVDVDGRRAGDVTHQRATHQPTTHPPATMKPVAFLVRATGPVEFQDPAAQSWERLAPSQVPAFTCPESCSIRTSPGTVVELETANGSKVRLNEKTEVSLDSAANFELRSGQLWCQTGSAERVTIMASPDDGEHAHRVDDVPPDQKALSNRTMPDPFLATCASPQSIATVERQPGRLQVTAASGNVEVAVGDETHPIPAGRTASVSTSRIEVDESAASSVQTERWMQPLLAMAGHGNPELSERVESLLAELGATKASWMRETDLRALGEYAAVPLLEFVLQKRSKSDVAKRRRAMAIAADTAPVWKVPDLISLLDDEDGEIRGSAAKALTRLTGQPSNPDTGAARWSNWWSANEMSCVPPTEASGS